jgi:hypothetical protein
MVRGRCGTWLKNQAAVSDRDGKTMEIECRREESVVAAKGSLPAKIT